MVIDRFKGEHRFLSNFLGGPVSYDGETYETVEHAYQAAKTTDLVVRKAIQECATPGRAKRLGQKSSLRPDWEDVKEGVMFGLLRIKFQIPEFRDKLLDTGSTPLIEGNTWGDVYWGVCRGEGENRLGKLLMRIREELS